MLFRSEQMPYTVVGKGCDYRHYASADKCGKSLAVDTLNIAYPSVVDSGLSDGSTARTDYVHVGARHAESIDSEGLQTGYHRFVDQTSVYHCHHAKHGLVCDAASFNHSGGDAQIGGDFCGGASSTVYEKFESVYGRKVAQKSVETALLLDNLASDLH